MVDAMASFKLKQTQDQDRIAPQSRCSLARKPLVANLSILNICCLMMRMKGPLAYNSAFQNYDYLKFLSQQYIKPAVLDFYCK